MSFIDTTEPGPEQTQTSAGDTALLPHWRDVPVTTWYQRRGKRLLDIAVSSVLVLLFLPVLLLAAALVLVSLGRPLFYTQDRPGRHGRPFRILKFRTMRPDRRTTPPPGRPPKDRRRTAKHAADPRHTRVGRLLRRTSIDELPQLLNVLRGDMGLVGPRPEILSVAVEKGLVDHARHAYRPGITCLWQIHDRNPENLEGKLRFDEEYVARVTFLGDLKLLAMTPVAVLTRRGE